MKNIIISAVCMISLFSANNLFSQKQSDEEAKDKTRVEVRSAGRTEASDSYRVMERAAARSGSSSSYSYGDGVFVISNSGSSSSQLSMSKTFSGESKKNEGSFEVEETVRSIGISLSGEVKTGEIKVRIILANGDVIKELVIDESADIQFNQNIKIAEDESKYYGKWRYTVESVKAEGRYRLMINTR